MKGIKIIGTGKYAPENIVTNDDLAETVETSHDWIVTRTGIEQRHIAADDKPRLTSVYPLHKMLLAMLASLLMISILSS
ncbi:3-oxoacyl-[acyl carrier protein] synthase III [Lentisphaera araneosa HTCC2155]|uniref:3-oxoacyl-[acyl carrier protein] synthase III n=1 Tax=Lentisphaera araneosa HTCC2155 TaxID=313628 RepID=A6DQ72_9BACT|nr:hypothetical protein [Lentisphaera araneosa]EDM26313.1 3-oxoacyl-[acyl carrier protein] synthase III [Lentisphaera araneosa HTCC2155]